MASSRDDWLKLSWTCAAELVSPGIDVAVRKLIALSEVVGIICVVTAPDVAATTLAESSLLVLHDSKDFESGATVPAPADAPEAA